MFRTIPVAFAKNLFSDGFKNMYFALCLCIWVCVCVHAPVPHCECVGQRTTCYQCVYLCNQTRGFQLGSMCPSLLTHLGSPQTETLR